MTTNKPLELYVHIPFCVRKCQYCDFLSFCSTPAERLAYCEALFSEINIKKDLYSNYDVVSIFFGGGTPTVLESTLLGDILRKLKEAFHVLPEAEITVECNPGTNAAEKDFRTLQESGFNRISIGMQSMQPEELKLLGRIHSGEEFLSCYQQAYEAGFHNINVDMMYGLPKQGLSDVLATLRELLSLPVPPPHISAYSLIVEEETPLYQLVEQGQYVLPSEEEEREMYWRVAELLVSHGYEHYEISNFAKPGYRCAHNVGYWTGVSYLGLGLGSSSYVDHRRFRNTGNMSRYLTHPGESVEELEELTARDEMAEFMFLGMRMREGVSQEEFQTRFGHSMEAVYGAVLEESRKDGLLELQGDSILLTRLGVDLSNYCFSRFL